MVEPTEQKYGALRASPEMRVSGISIFCDMDTTVESLRRAFFDRLADCIVRVDGALSGAENMRRDIEMAESLQEHVGNDRIYVRLYCWQPWCISLGKTQPDGDIAYDRARDDGIEIVRRPTGGRAILHARELTYALAMRLSGGLLHSHVYRFWHEWLLSVLRTRFGAEGMAFARSQPDFPLLFQRQPTRWLCFASSARFELLWHGRKLLGSAQRLWGDVLLQHGSLLIGNGHERLPYYLRDCTNPDTIAAYLARRSVTLEEICNRPVSFEELSTTVAEELRQKVALRY